MYRQAQVNVPWGTATSGEIGSIAGGGGMQAGAGYDGVEGIGLSGMPF